MHKSPHVDQTRFPDAIWNLKLDLTRLLKTQDSRIAKFRTEKAAKFLASQHKHERYLQVSTCIQILGTLSLETNAR
jgi:hypothetical protein